MPLPQTWPPLRLRSSEASSHGKVAKGACKLYVYIYIYIYYLYAASESHVVSRNVGGPPAGAEAARFGAGLMGTWLNG